MCLNPRRHFLKQLAGGLALPALGGLSACNDSRWPEGMVEIRWDRDTCSRCNMVISDRRFAAEITGQGSGQVFRFDDIGCLLFWLRDKTEKHIWLSSPDIRLWVADFNSESRDAMRWLDPRQARFINKTSPMGYNFAALGAPNPDAVDFNQMRQLVLAKGK